MSSVPSRELPPDLTWDPDLSWPTVWAAAAYAHRYNGGYYKPADRTAVIARGQRVETNRVVMERVLRDQSLIKQEDRLLGSRARDYLSKHLMFRVLASNLSAFDQYIIKVCAIEDFVSFHNAHLYAPASMISVYREETLMAEAVSRARDSSGLGTPGDRVDVEIEIVRSVHSQRYDAHFITAITTSNHMVFFAHKSRMPPGEKAHVRGTVRDHAKDSLRGAYTRLNRVQVVQ